MRDIRVNFIDLMEHKTMGEEEYQRRFKEIMNETTSPVDRLFLRRLYELHCEIRDDEVIKEAQIEMRNIKLSKNV